MTKKEESEKIIKFKDGDNVTCVYKNKLVEGKISISEWGEVFLCSDDIYQGKWIEDTKGYKYSWSIYDPNCCDNTYEDFIEVAKSNEVEYIKLHCTKKTSVITFDEISSAEYDSESAEMIKSGVSRI